MKKTALAALLALCLCAPLPAQAADWTNGTVSCDVVDIVLDNPMLFWLWGKWNEYNVNFN